ncbi:MAG: hypothetical protein WA941_23615 [Nitrososphaeraceae archaeon]
MGSYQINLSDEDVDKLKQTIATSKFFELPTTNYIPEEGLIAPDTSFPPLITIAMDGNVHTTRNWQVSDTIEGLVCRSLFLGNELAIIISPTSKTFIQEYC